MTTKAINVNAKGMNAEEGFEEDFEITPSQRIREVAKIGAVHLKRTIVFAPIFGVLFLAVGFMWVKDFQAERTILIDSDSLRILLSQLWCFMAQMILWYYRNMAKSVQQQSQVADLSGLKEWGI